MGTATTMGGGSRRLGDDPNGHMTTGEGKRQTRDRKTTTGGWTPGTFFMDNTPHAPCLRAADREHSS